MDDSDKNAESLAIYCKECGEKLKAKKKCFQCGSYQQFNWIESFKSLSSATAFIIVIISMISLMQTCQEKHNAEEAAKVARQASEDTQKARVAAETAKKEAIRESKELVQKVESQTKSALDKIIEDTKKGSKALKEITGLIDVEKLKLDTLSNRAIAVSNKVKLLEDNIEFQQILISARNDKKKSYDQLKNLALNDSYPFKKEANEHFVCYKWIRYLYIKQFSLLIRL